MLTFIAAIFVFTLLVVIHEFGHFIIARLSGVKVEEFALGMGPKIWGYQAKETLYSIRAFPLGGFCKMLGEDESNQDPRAFNNKPIFKRIAIIAFGPIMNFILTVLIFSLVFSYIPMISQVSENSPASKAGMVAGDEITEINGTMITEWDQIRPIVDANKGKEINVKFERKGEIKEVNVVPVPREGEEGAMIGVVPSIGYQGFSITRGLNDTINITKEMYKFLGQLFTGNASMEYVEGPVKIVMRIGEAAEVGVAAVLQFAGFLSLNLCIINLLPLPALDGGRLIFLFIEAIRRKPIDPQKEGIVHFIGFVLLMILSVFIIYKDIITL
ncbi:MAG TPA: RIP metalloprotease RseP [Patescibacteria group bacterium]|nr:RIP metalloprotease RseP [Patescibacteria group bacterium]